MITRTTKILLMLSTLLGIGSAPSNEPKDFNQYGSKKSPIVIDLAIKAQVTFKFSNQDKVYVSIKNMLPKRRDIYSIEFDSKTLTPLPFEDPRIAKELENDSSSDKPNKNAHEVLDACDTITGVFNKTVTAIHKLDKESELPEQLEKVKQSILLSPEDCKDFLKAAKKLIAQTSMHYEIDVAPHTEYTIKVSHSEKEIAGLTLSNPPTEWLTHVGMTFFDNKDKYFYSDKVTTSVTDPQTGLETEQISYQVAQGADRGGLAYAATAIFTYPVINRINGSDIDIVLSAGLGVEKDNISALVGVSLIIHRNLVITLGVIGSEFDVLKGDYELGDALGDSSVDSTNLITQTYKFAPMLTLAYKFD